jgi:hypothetical protein
MRSRLLGLTLLCAACGDDPPSPVPDFAEPPDIETTLAYESDHVRVFTRPGRVFCQGDGARMDAHIERLSTLLDIKQPPQLPVYVLGDPDENLINEWCFDTLVEDKTLGGCFRNWMVVTQARFWSHEIDHAVLYALNPTVSTKFWREAYASAWETEESLGDFSEMLPEQNPVGAYSEGQSLVRWLMRVQGIVPVRDFYASLESDWDRGERDAAFMDIFGLVYEDAISQYDATMPHIDPGFAWCDDVETIDVPLGDTPLTLDFDCDSPSTHTFAYYDIEGMYVRRILRLEQSADLVIEYSTEAGIRKRHPCLETPIVSEDDPRLSNYAWLETMNDGEPNVGTMSLSDGVPTGDNLFEFVVPFGASLTIEAVIHAEPSEYLP